MPEPELPTHTVKHIIYNPDLLSKEELIACFVARQNLLNRLLRDIHLEGDAGSPQHQIIVGRRGMGKTTLLRRLAYAIEDDPTLNQRWLPLTFREEQYNVVRLSDLWLNCIDSLSDRLEHQGDRTSAHALDSALDALPVGDDETLQRAALNLLLAESRRLDRRLILLIDNLGMILSHLKSEDWRLREVLSDCERLLIIGASAYHLEATYNYDGAFYDFFNLHELSGLTTDETHAVLTTLARRTRSPEVEKLLTEQPARIKTLHVLTGGNPRTVNLLFGILASGLTEDVEADLAQLLDRCTPLYKARLEALAPQAQQIIDAMATHWDPITAAELANITRLETRTVSSQLTRLVHDGVVEKLKSPFTIAGAGESAHRKLGYQLAERFFNMWHLMRSSRRVRCRLVWLVRFMSMLFTPEQLHRYANRRQLATTPAHLDRWPEATEHAQAFIKALDGLQAAIWSDIVTFFAEAVQHGHAHEAAKLIDANNLTERWRP
ncbi:MAG: ATP-binding protein, partial [Myxococcota bacterium]